MMEPPALYLLSDDTYIHRSMGTEVGGTELDCDHYKDGSRDKERDHNRDTETPLQRVQGIGDKK